MVTQIEISIGSTDGAAATATVPDKAEKEGVVDAAKENVVNDSAAAVATVGPASKTNDNDTLTVSRFLVQNIRAGRGYAESDYQIDLIAERHGLYDLVSAVYDTLDALKLTDDAIYSHLWSVSFAGKNYNNGWRRYNPMQISQAEGGVWDRPAGENEVDFGERRIFSSLATGPLAAGQKGECRGESATFDIVLKDVSVKTVKEADVVVNVARTSLSIEDNSGDKPNKKMAAGKGSCNEKEKYPQIRKVNNPVSGILNDDWITPPEKAKCATLRAGWQAYFSGVNSWKRDRRYGDWVPGKAQSPAWNGGDEVKIMGLLINSDCKFKKSWNAVMQHAFVDRSESAASMKWYQLKGKDSYMIEHHGRGMTNDSRVRLAKRLARRSVTRMFDERNAPPVRDPHPDAKVLAKLRKRGAIDGGTSREEKRRLVVMYREYGDSFHKML